MCLNSDLNNQAFVFVCESFESFELIVYTIGSTR